MSRAQDCCISALVLSSRIFLRTCGYGLMVVYLGLVGGIGYSFVNYILPEYSISLFTIITTVIFFLCAVGSIFNYLSAALSSPGYTEDYKHGLLRGEGGSLPNCRTCNIPKPENAHHCSFCNKCILNLDHHCPWINNCVGFNNMRFFLLFLLYSFLACAIHVVMSIPIFLEPTFSLDNIEMPFFFASVLSLTVSIALFFFNMWSWYLAATDQQFIDVLKARKESQQGFREESAKFVWSKAVLKRRLFEVFGTEKLHLALLPSRRKLTINPISCDIEKEELLNHTEIEISTRK